MPEWLQITGSVVALIGSIFGIMGLSVYINERTKHRAARKNKQEDDETEAAERVKEERYRKVIVEAITKEIAPITQELNDFKIDIDKIKKGVQASNRADLQAIVDKADQQGWLSTYDKERFEQLYHAYHDLGKNGVMDSHRERILALPDIPPSNSKNTEIL